jgi:hypothetical protein
MAIEKTQKTMPVVKRQIQDRASSDIGAIRKGRRFHFAAENSGSVTSGRRKQGRATAGPVNFAEWAGQPTHVIVAIMALVE